MATDTGMGKRVGNTLAVGNADFENSSTLCDTELESTAPYESGSSVTPSSEQTSCICTTDKETLSEESSATLVEEASVEEPSAAHIHATKDIVNTDKEAHIEICQSPPSEPHVAPATDIEPREGADATNLQPGPEGITQEMDPNTATNEADSPKNIEIDKELLTKLMSLVEEPYSFELPLVEEPPAIEMPLSEESSSTEMAVGEKINVPKELEMTQVGKRKFIDASNVLPVQLVPLKGDTIFVYKGKEYILCPGFKEQELEVDTELEELNSRLKELNAENEEREKELKEGNLLLGKLGVKTWTNRH